MSNIRIPVAVCVAVADVLNGSHEFLDALFEASGAPGPPPELAHHSKWKTWLQRVGNDPDVDSLRVLGTLIEEFMDVAPQPTGNSASELFGFNLTDPVDTYNKKREHLTEILEEYGFRYFRGGRVIQISGQEDDDDQAYSCVQAAPVKPSTLDDLLKIVIQGLPRAMQPLVYRRKDAHSLTFASEYDIQDLLHALLRPWILDIRPEEFCPSYAGSNTRMDFFLPTHKVVIETKRVRDKAHAKKIGDELIIDIEHYRKHDGSDYLWCVIYDPELFLSNPSGLVNDLEGERHTPEGKIAVKVMVVGASA